MTMNFTIIAANQLSIEADWNEQLVALLGYKPRRLSRWCELGLFGAMSCLSHYVKRTGQRELASSVAIRIYSEFGTIKATHQAMEQAREHVPMPFTFMQTQPGQLLNVLGNNLNWHGDGYTVSGKTRRETELALLRDISESALLALVDEEPQLSSRWVWLKQTTPSSDLTWASLDSLFQVSPDARWLRLTNDGQLFQAQ